MSGCPPEPDKAAQARFARALEAAACRRRGGGIGTLGEKPLHMALKCYCEPDTARHEVRVGRYVADAFDGERITEIQTRNFAAIRPKLTALLEHYPVTLVCPVVRRCTICRMDGATGEIVTRRLSPKIGSPASAFGELIRIRPLLTHPRLRVRVILVDAVEMRPQAPAGERVKGDRVPSALMADIPVDAPAEYLRLLPAGLPEGFTTRDLAAAQPGLRLQGAQAALNVLRAVGAVELCGTRGRLRLYRLAGGPIAGTQGDGAPDAGISASAAVTG